MTKSKRRAAFLSWCARIEHLSKSELRQACGKLIPIIGRKFKKKSFEQVTAEQRELFRDAGFDQKKRGDK